MNLLVVEDSSRLRRSLEHGLRRSGFSVDLVEDGEAALEFARHRTYDVVLLDLMLPKVDGLSVLRRLRAEGNPVHVLIMSAKDEVQERIEGLHCGADDYLPKPFDFDELVARIRALVRRRYGTKSPFIDVEGLRVDTAQRVVTRGDRPVDLTRNEYVILERLLMQRGAVVTKEQLLRALYADADRGSANAVEVFIHQLRKKLGPPEVIRTRRGHGYLIE